MVFQRLVRQHDCWAARGPKYLKAMTVRSSDWAAPCVKSLTLAKIRWNRALATRFLGTWLTEPKPHVFFEPPAAPLSRAAFIARASRAGVTLDLRTQLLYDDAHVFANGSADAWPAGGAAELARLADGRALSAADCARLPRSAATLVYRWYRDGYLHVAAH